jgi:hypothetical protein
MILSQTLGDDFLHLTEAEATALNTVLENELLTNAQVRKAVEGKVRDAHKKLRAKG